MTISNLAVHAMRGALFVPRSIASLMLLGLLTLSGCGGDGPASPTLRSIQITPSNPSLAAGTSVQLAATAIYSNSTHADVTTQAAWSSSSTAIATVGAGTGNVLAVTAGMVTLTATLQGQSVTTTLTVTPASLVSVQITPPLPGIAAGTTQQFTATGTFSDNTTQNVTADMTWTSSDAAVATVNGSGLATGVSPGNVTISALCSNQSTCGSIGGSAPLSVTAATLTSIAITPAAPSIALGLNQQLTATGTYSDHSTQNLTGQVTWSSDTISVATTSNASATAGQATSVAVGTTHITATLGAVTSPAVTLTVTSASLVSISITPPTPVIAIGFNQQFTATGTYTDNSTQNVTTAVTWASANPAVASVSNAASSNGVATSLSVGTSNITATLGTVTSPAVPLTVTAATLTSIAITPATPSIALGLNQQFTATGTYTDNSTQDVTTAVTWTSSDPTAASVSNAASFNGLATSLSVGTHEHHGRTGRGDLTGRVPDGHRRHPGLDHNHTGEPEHSPWKHCAIRRPRHVYR